MLEMTIRDYETKFNKTDIEKFCEIEVTEEAWQIIRNKINEIEKILSMNIFQIISRSNVIIYKKHILRIKNLEDFKKYYEKNPLQGEINKFEEKKHYFIYAVKRNHHEFDVIILILIRFFIFNTEEKEKLNNLIINLKKILHFFEFSEYINNFKLITLDTLSEETILDLINDKNLSKDLFIYLKQLNENFIRGLYSGFFGTNIGELTIDSQLEVIDYEKYLQSLIIMNKIPGPLIKIVAVTSNYNQIIINFEFGYIEKPDILYDIIANLINIINENNNENNFIDYITNLNGDMYE